VAAPLACPAVGLRRDHGLRPGSAKVFGAAFPDLSHRVRLRAPQPVALPERVIPDSGATVLGVLGNLNAQKGARVIQGLARRLSATGDPRSIVVIGNVDASISLPARVRIHGGYDNTRIAELARRYGICAWLIPSVWPETYSFATREALATGLPVFAFDIGAQGEAVRAAPNGTSRALTTPMRISLCGSSRRCRRSPPTRRMGTDRVRCPIAGRPPDEQRRPLLPAPRRDRPCSSSVAFAPAPR
jgi:hypothetical protein